MSIQNRKVFHLDEYIQKLQNENSSEKDSPRIIAGASKKEQFLRLCKTIMDHFMQEWESEVGKNNEATEKLLIRQKQAIIGYPKEVNYFKGKISEFLKSRKLQDEWFPNWYPDLVTAIFQENWGIAGVYQWKSMPGSSSAKIIGERIYFLIDGEQVLMPQTISRERFTQLVTALLLRTPQKRMDNDYEEVYMLDQTRITIFDEGLAKEPCIVFRKYIVDVYTFEEQVRLGTIPAASVPMLKAMNKVGYNVAFVGPVRSSKTTFLTTWQSYEDQSLEGIQVETDPEIPLHIIMPKAPIMQIVADGDRLSHIIKPLMRSDGDYLIMAEARDGVALKIAMDVTKKGTRRVKITFHTSDPIDFCYDAATEIVQTFGGDIWATTIKIAKGYHYLFEFCQLKDKSQKRLKGIYEIRYDPKSLNITIHQICKYDFLRDDWYFAYDVGSDKEEIAKQEDYEAYKVFKSELKHLADQKPMQDDHVFEMPYMKFMLNK